MPAILQYGVVIRAFVNYALIAIATIPALFRAPREQAIVELALGQQLATYAHKHTRPQFTPLDRAFWIALARFWPRRKTCLVVVQPETVIRWHRKGFRRY